MKDEVKKGAPRLAYEHLGLWRNPFGVPTPEDWAVLAVVDVEDSVAKAMRGDVVQIVGEPGRGKSTYMRAMHRAIDPEAPFVYVGPGERPLIPSRAPVVFVDEGQRLRPWTRMWLGVRVHTLVFGTHGDHTSELRLVGRRVHTVRVGGSGVRQLAEMIRRRIAWASREEEPRVWVTEEAVAGLVTLCSDDVRRAMKLMFRIFERMEEPGAMLWPPPEGVEVPGPSRHLAPGGVREVNTRAPGGGVW
ncbi:MAG: ABC transporter ATP-binding protein [Myxococcota bacterium]